MCVLTTVIGMEYGVHAYGTRITHIQYSTHVSYNQGRTVSRHWPIQLIPSMAIFRFL